MESAGISKCTKSLPSGAMRYWRRGKDKGVNMGMFSSLADRAKRSVNKKAEGIKSKLADAANGALDIVRLT